MDNVRINENQRKLGEEQWKSTGIGATETTQQSIKRNIYQHGSTKLNKTQQHKETVKNN